ncbi:PREDICTED: cytochrome P450 86B1 [Camelina sativa]|uniref:Cytochrome P450 86B1 n=1 Tax=Camelina sativa TaxID=90675 RepID=A0ABM0V961_CAMSA|nr:PREDICTED: cytochrome P450 86B1 [Camelina sativa]
MNYNSSAYNLTAAASHHEPLVSRRLLFLRDVQILELFIALFVFVTIHSLRQKKHQGMPVWPFLGMLPSLILAVRSNIYEWLSDILISRNGTFRFRGPWFSTLNCVVTCDPRNVEHILKTRFSIYPKGSYFRETMRDLLGDGIFNADEETWQRQRKTASVEFHSANFRQLTSQSLHELVHNRLLPVLETSEKIDLQDILLRLTFDNVCMIAFGVDPGCLSPNLPEIPFAKAFEDATEATAVRFVMPGFVWKLMRSLNLGTEKNLKESIKGVDYFADEVIKTRKKELSLETETAKRSDLLTIFMGLRDDNGEKFSVKFLRDICVNFILAGRDTSSVALSWFFWLIEKNPEVEENIMVVICKILEQRDDNGDTKKNIEYEPVFRPEEIKKMDYLQAALSEALRLYPSVPVDHKEVLEDDVFPDGTKLKKGEKVIYALYAMARMELIWGKDCCEFKPERWLGDGRYTSESAYKFTAFNGGPRLCLGKDFAYYQMKYVAATIIYRYRVSMKGGHKVEPKMALTMYMKHGLKVTMVKRSAFEIDHYYR